MLIFQALSPCCLELLLLYLALISLCGMNDMQARYLFNTSGDYVAFVYGDNVFSPDCEWIGWVASGGDLYSVSGDFMGKIQGDDRVVRRRGEPQRPKVARRARPVRPLRPLRPLKRLRMPKLPPPYVDVFEYGSMTGDSRGISPGPKFEELIGSRVVASNGVHLGDISVDRNSPTSLKNVYGMGSKYNPNSIFNKYGSYGNKFNALSPFNEYTRTPPRIEREGSFVAFLTKNKFVSPRVDTDQFIDWFDGI